MSKDNRGSFSKNKYKKTEAEPDIRGTAMIGGIEYKLAAWKNTDDEGNIWYAARYTPKEQPPAALTQTRAQTDKRVPLAEMDDDIPF